MKPKSKLVEALRGKLMALIKDIEAIFGRGQDDAATQPQIRKHQIVVGDDDVANDTVGVNKRGQDKPERNFAVDDFIARLGDEVAAKV